MTTTDKLTKKEEAFIEHYLTSGNAAAAARAAGYSHKSAKEIGYKLKNKLKPIITERFADAMDDLQITQLQALDTLRYYATAPPSHGIAPKDQIAAARELLSHIAPKNDGVQVNINNSNNAISYEHISDDELDALIDDLS